MLYALSSTLTAQSSTLTALCSEFIPLNESSIYDSTNRRFVERPLRVFDSIESWTDGSRDP
ncbi:MAG: hypothetical protein KKG06_04315 [Bacteroidetes bacterium]|nr:hypothetical protein [Bacteroidota bacterium]